ncbi:hypothetical protein GHT06_017738 [Daphnia sinensis]|uniref:MADF domain-containing protein n=1 Tax=Daphnia sinensis TaxID=1820382 RepID=A0AAD5PRS2_9CRUS|nr:hypothetical protein GHT06_017738 [Daphnia sinensis]
MVSTLRTPCAADQLLIEEVRQHEVLYACPTKSNKDNQLRDTAWQEIADAVGKSVEEAKERWRYMRDKYVKELGRNDKYRVTNGGSAIEPPDATSFVGLMSFLNPFIKRKSSNGEICALPIEATVESVDVSHYHPPSKRQRIQPVHQQEDTTSLFCASIAGMLAELQPYHRERIKRDIYNLVSDALLTELSN